MPFAYYAGLSNFERAVYDQSNRVRAIRLHEYKALQPLTTEVREALETKRRPLVEEKTRVLLDALTDTFEVPRVKLKVLLVRPSNERSELHGLYTRPPKGQPRIEVWMRTAKQARVVAFRTYLRTVLHELCHHLDFTLLDLPISFHTESFYRRESSLFWQLVPASPR